MSASLTELLAPQVILEVISRLKKGRGPLGSWLGFQPNTFDPDTVTVKGPNTLTGTGSVRNVSYRIFDQTRVPMKLRAPGTGPATVAQNPMGVNTVSVARFHQKIPLNYEFLGNLSPMIGPNSQVDAGGQDYIARQTSFLGQQVNNSVEVMAAGMMRDSLYYIQTGDDWMPTFTAPVLPTVGFQIPFQIPAGNKNQLNMLGAGNIITTSWANPAALIISNIQSVIAAYRQLNRYPMQDIWINSLMWMNIISNTQVRNTAGSSNTPFAEFTKHPARGMGEPGGEGEYSAIIRGQPTVKFHFCDDVFAFNTDIDPTYSTAPSGATLVKAVPDTMAIFTTEPDPDWCKLYLGGEYVVENPGMAGVLRMGHYFWKEFVTQPGAVELLAVLNAIPLLYVPSVIAPGTVVF